MTDQELPATWRLTNLGAVVDYGKTRKAEPEEIEDDAWILELEDIERDTSRVLAKSTYKTRLSKSTKNRFEIGDVLYGKLRPYLNKVVIADQAGYCTTEIIPIDGKPFLDNRYVFYWLKHPVFLSYVESASHGLNMPRLGTETGKTAPFVLAPHQEQIRIADKLDSLLMQVDACRNRLDNIPGIIKRFRQTVLNAATTGDLTNEWQKGDFDQSKRWTTGVLIDLLKNPPRNGYSPRTVDYITQTKTLALSATTTGRFQAEFFKYIDEPIPHTSHLWLHSDDILIQRANTIEYVGISAIYEGDANQFIYPDLMMKACANNKVLPKFLLYMLQSNSTRKYFRDNASGTAGNMPKINQKTVMNVPVRYPCIEEQAEIVRLVESLFTFADRLEARYTLARAQVANLRPTLLAKAFCGKLVPQDPHDEPANELLERIRTARQISKGKLRK